MIRGEIDERETDRQRLLVVRGEMLNAQTRRSTGAFEFECLLAALEKRLAAEVDRLAGQLTENEKIGGLPTTAGQFEIESLKGATIADLRRMKRSRPHTRETPFFRLPGEEPFAGAPRIVNVDAPLGRYLLEKAINRLEVILFLSPDDVRAAYALGFCHSMHLSGIYRPELADELLRRAYSADPRSKQAALALEYLMQISFDDRTGELDAGGKRRRWSESGLPSSTCPPMRVIPAGRSIRAWPAIYCCASTITKRCASCWSRPRRSSVSATGRLATCWHTALPS